MVSYLSKVLYVISGSRSKLIWLLTLFVITSVFEVVSIGLLGPFIKIASEPDNIQDIALLNHAYMALGLQNSESLIPILGLIICSIFSLKSILYFYSRSSIYRFGFNENRSLMTKLLSAYLKVPYTFHLSNNTANMIGNIVVESNRFIQGGLLQLLNATVNLIITVSLLLLLARSNFILLVAISVVLVPTFLILNLLRPRIAAWGKKRTVAHRGMILTANHALGSVKETKIFGCEEYFENEMTNYGHQFSTASTLFLSSQLLPRVSIETILIIFLVVFVCLYQSYSSGDVADLNSTLSIFAVTAMRLIPSTSQFMQAIGEIQSTSYTLDSLYVDLKELEKVRQASHGFKNKDFLRDSSPYVDTDAECISFSDSLRLEGVSYRYPGALEDSVKDVSISLKKGDCIAFIGKSGAGKTTLADMLLGLLQPTAGDIKVDKRSIYRNISLWQNLVGYIPQSIFLIDDTIEKNIAFGIPTHRVDHDKLLEAIESAQLSELINDLPDGISTKVGERGVRLSGGQRQRIGIARALYAGREIIVLDEATSALDNETEALISESIRSLSGVKTLILIAHRLSTIEHCDCVYVLDKGKLMKSGRYSDIASTTS